MAYIGKIPAAAALTSSDIADSIITEAKMADDAISLAELKAGTDGEIISWDASGNPVAIGAGTSGHFLKSQGAGSQPVFAAASAAGLVKLLSTTISSGVAAVAFDNNYMNLSIYTTHDNSTYAIAAQNSAAVDQAGDYGGVTCSYILDVTSTSNCKCSMYVAGFAGRTTQGNTASQETGLTFIKLGDT